jgi:hypothetical protein
VERDDPSPDIGQFGQGGCASLNGGKPKLEDTSTWTDRLGSSKLRTFTDADGHFWLEQNPEKRSKWASSPGMATMSRGSSSAPPARTPAECLSMLG